MGKPTNLVRMTYYYYCFSPVPHALLLPWAPGLGGHHHGPIVWGVGEGEKAKRRERMKKRVAIEMGKNIVPIPAFQKQVFACKINADSFFNHVFHFIP